MAAPVIIAKVAAEVLKNPKARTAVVSIIAGAVLLLLLPGIMLMSLSGGMNMDTSSLVAQLDTQSLMQNLTPSEQASLQKFKTVMAGIANEMDAEGYDESPTKAQIIYLCALQGKETEPDFYATYIACFGNAESDGQIYDNISAAFGVTFTADDRKKISELCDSALASAVSADPNVSIPPGAGGFVCPIHAADWKSHITSGFGPRTDPVTGQPGTFHAGIDIAMPMGTPIYAGKAGKVTAVLHDTTGYGNHIIIDHGGGVTSLYGHMSETLAQVGDIVDTDTIIGKVGSTGKSTGPHLHFTINVNGTPANPMNYLS